RNRMSKKTSAQRQPAARLMLLVAFAGLLGLLAACNTGGNVEPTPMPEATTEPTFTVTEPERGQAIVNSIDILMMESFPVQVRVVARGDLPDSCTEIDEII